MNRVIALAFTVALAIAVVTAGSIRAAGPEQDKPADEATALAVKLTEQGAATFDTFNAKAMADYYLEDAEIAMVTKEEGRTQVPDPHGPGRDREVLRRHLQEARDHQVEEYRRVRQADRPRRPGDRRNLRHQHPQA